MLGSHDGIHRFTVGQRKGLGLSSPTGAPMYVLALRPADQQVVVGPKASLEQTRLTASGVNWIAEEPAGRAARRRRRSGIAIRRRPPRCDRSATGAPRSIFDAPQLAITPGQAVVFYDGDSVRRRRVDRLDECESRDR